MRKRVRLFLGALALLIISGPATQAAVRWQPTLDGAKRTAVQTNRLVLVYFWADWCSACRLMEQNVLSSPEAAAALEANYVPVKVNASHFPATARQYGVTALPATVAITPDGRLVDKMLGRVDLATYVARLNQVASAARGPSVGPIAQAPAVPPAMPSQVQPPQREFQPPVPASPSWSHSPAAATEAGNGGQAREMPPNPAYGNAPYGDRRMTAEESPGRPTLMPPRRPEPQHSIVPPGLSATSPPSQPGPVPERPMPGPPSAGPPTGNPPLALDGYCPVQLYDDMIQSNRKWTLSDRRWGIIHLGRTYLFSGPEQARRFYADPERYAPVLSGNDVVMAVDHGQMVAGRRQYGIFFAERIYLFSTEANLDKFSKAPERYASAARQVMQGGTKQRTAAGPRYPYN